MTISQKYQVELSDIVSVKVSCLKCQTSVNIPPDKFKELRTHCPNCTEQWFVNDKDPSLRKVYQFVEFIKELGELPQTGKLSLSLEIAPPSQA